MEPALAIPNSSTAWAAVRPLSGPAGALANLWSGNPLELPPEPETTPESRAPWIVWSGSLASDLTTPELRNWMGPGLAALAPAVAGLAAQAQERGSRLLIRPHARHILCDALSTRRWLEEQDAASIGLALDPLALLEPPMLDAAEEHLERIFETLGPLSEALLCFGHAGEPLDAPLQRADLARLCIRLAEETAPGARMVVLSPESPGPVREALAGYTRPAET